MSEPTKKRVGRPSEGSGKKGEPHRIRDFPTLLLIVRPAVRAKLKAVATVENRAAWRVVEDAIAAYFEQLQPETRRAVQAEIRRASKGA